MFKNTKYFLTLLGILFLLAACKKKQAPIDLGYDYFPSNIGHWCIYDVDSIIYDDFNKTIVKYKYQIKEIVESSIYDNSHRKTQRIERYFRAKSSDAWVIRDIWTSYRSNTNAEKYEENVRYVKLIFPVKVNKTWNGNVLNTIGEWNYEYTEVDKPYEIGGYSFDSTLTVLQIGDSSLIEKKDYREVYAKHVGLVYKHFVDVKDKDSKINFSQSFTKRIDAGFDYTYTLNSYGD